MYDVHYGLGAPTYTVSAPSLHPFILPPSTSLPLLQELIPESRSLQAPMKDSIRQILSDTVQLLSYDTSWLTDLNAHHRFAFGVVAVCCSRLPISEQLDWMCSYAQVIEQLGKIYTSYCNHQGIEEEARILTELPAAVRQSPLEEMHSFFQWVIVVQSVLALWKRKFMDQTLTFDQMLEYIRLGRNIENVGAAVCGSLLVVDPTVVEEYKSSFLRQFEKLNLHLIKYIPGHPEAQW